MRKYIKAELFDLLHTLLKANKSIKKICKTGIREENRAAFEGLLQDCQDAAINIGNTIEKFEGEGTDAVSALERYCELLYLFSVREETDTYKLDECINECIKETGNLKDTLEIVFLPYKASMWDSLESIWMEAKSDPDSSVYVIPIPYYDKKPDGSLGDIHYEGEDFPEYVPVTSFEEYSLEERHPDMIFIHNPYDEWNHVTSIHPYFYSSQIKKYTDKLVYVPYYVTSGNMSEGFMQLPVYYYMDYGVFQSQKIADKCRQEKFYKKILPMGSPKLDRVIRMCKEGSQMPSEWKEFLDDKHVLMLNTSINDLLVNSETILKKLYYFFLQVKKNSKIGIIWRPHPLLEATIKSLRPEMWEFYLKLMQFFLENKIGVLDKTPDITETIVLSDGYIGSSGSSVINLFAVTGKPVFLFNNAFYGEVNDEDRRTLKFSGATVCNNRLYLVCNYLNLLFSIDLNEEQKDIKCESELTDELKWRNPFGEIMNINGKLYPAPFFASDIIEYDIEKKDRSIIRKKTEENRTKFWSLIRSGSSIFYLPIDKKLIGEYNVEKKKWTDHTKGMEALWEGIDRNVKMPLICGGTEHEGKVYLSNGVDNRVLVISSATSKEWIIFPGNSEMQIQVKGRSKEGMLLIDRKHPEILFCAPWDDLNRYDTWKKYEIPDDYLYEGISLLNNGPYGFFREVGSYIIVFPNKVPHMMKIHKETGEVKYIAEDFWKGSDEPYLDFDPYLVSICHYLTALGNGRYLVQRNRDCHLAIIDCVSEEYEEITPVIANEVFDSMITRDSGFEKGDDDDYFAMRESRLFPLENFLDSFSEDGLEGIKDRQIESLSSMAANLDGTCGKKVYSFLKSK